LESQIKTHEKTESNRRLNKRPTDISAQRYYRPTFELLNIGRYADSNVKMTDKRCPIISISTSRKWYRRSL